MSLTESVNNLAALVEGLSDDINGKIDELNEARDKADTAGDAAIAEIVRQFDPKVANVIFLDAVNGDDSRTGLSSVANSVQTWERAFELVTNASRQQIRLCSDIDVDRLIPFNSFNPLLEIRGTASDGAAVQRRKITFLDSAVAGQGNFAGGLHTHGQFQLHLREIDIDLASSVVSSPFRSNLTMMHVWWLGGSLTKSGTAPTGNGALFEPQGLGLFRFTNVLIDPSAEGYVIDDVPAGTDPNANPLYLANFTSA